MTAEPAHRVSWLRGFRSFFLGALLLLCVLALLPAFRSFGYQFFSTPSGSMKPTLLVGDYFVAAKYPYGYSGYSFPGSPQLFSGRIFAAEPHPGDVVVFRLPREPLADYVKRLVGVPGDRIQVTHGLLYINGTPVERERIDDLVETDTSGRVARGKQWRETLPNGATYVTLDLIDEGYYDNTPVYVVPSGHYFMMGDNRDNAQDSRIGQFGYVPFENLIGRGSFSRSTAEHVRMISRCGSSAPAYRYANQPIASRRPAPSAAARSRPPRGR
jgi:signal peptidase I